ncbi:MAG: hypothetical protein LBQ88_09475 [Treponema sp.]|jgi:hypothetical protein|nr:hypothetical protein [Treponema sp.]
MNQRLQNILNGKTENHLLPFFWQHGEDEAVLRDYMRAINEANIGAVCVESRPHPDFCGPLWWRDMDIILDEARKRRMKVWILDDSHFPTGYANGAMKNQSDERCRKSVTYRIISCERKRRIRLDDELAHPLPVQKSALELGMEKMRGPQPRARIFDDDRLLCVSAMRWDSGQIERRDLTGFVHDGILEWEVPAGNWNVYILHITGNAGYHPDYINMMDAASCRVLIDAVYEPHYAHYKNDFGKTIAGFFSDEPEFGNGHLYVQDNLLGTDQDLPWSAELEDHLRSVWGDSYASLLPLLWDNPPNAAADHLSARVRHGYMDAVTRLLEKDFSLQIGEWCRAHKVEYIGHIIEDNNQHARTGSSLGHYFRSMSGQDMAGIDDIGGQVYPQGEDVTITGQVYGNRNGEFYHYALGKLASSYAAIDPIKKGRSMCEIFGNYGWREGIRLEKYLADHFMVRGINNFVPHAFSPKEFPDPDCPPHFYAHGHNPQYRHFGALMAYMNRVCTLISDGRHAAPAAVLYHGEAEWAGNCMTMEKPCHLLADAQIEYDIIPQDVFIETDRYKTTLGEFLTINSQEYRALIVPYSQFVTNSFANAVQTLLAAGFPVIFIDGLPDAVSDIPPHDTELTALSGRLSGAAIIDLDELVPVLRAYLKKNGGNAIAFSPEHNRLRYLQYIHDDGTQVYFMVNEGTTAWNGSIRFPHTQQCAVYNAWDNQIETVSTHITNDYMEMAAVIEPLKGLIVIFDDTLPSANNKETPRICADAGINLKENWKRSICCAFDYPAFGESKTITLPDTLAGEKPDFAGFVRYERSLTLTGKQLSQPRKIIEITDAYEGVELFINGVSAGIQITPPFRYCIDDLAREGENFVTIEVATTLERQVQPSGFMAAMEASQPGNPLGITGHVILYFGSLDT